MSTQSLTFGPDFILKKSTNSQTPDTKKENQTPKLVYFLVSIQVIIWTRLFHNEHETSIDDLVHDCTDVHVSQGTHTGVLGSDVLG